jgi:LemA protein
MSRPRWKGGQARAQATGIRVTPELLKDPAAFEQFQKVQSGLTSAPVRLIAIAENYPNLKADQNFRDLQGQLEGTENRIAVARKRYVERVAEYNKMVRFFPTELTAKLLLHLEEKPQPHRRSMSRHGVAVGAPRACAA